MSRAAPSPEPFDKTPQELFLDNLELIEKVIAGVARQYRWPPQEAEDFASEAKLHLIEDDYKVLRDWDRRAGLQSYLLFVIGNLARDRLRCERGRPRASAAAVRLGPIAAELEILLGRHGHSCEEAFLQLKPRYPELTRKQVEEMAAEVKPRPCRRFEGDEAIAELGAPEVPADERLARQEGIAARRRALEILQRALDELSEDDRLVVRLSACGVKVSQIAVSLSREARHLYRQRKKVWEALHKRLGAEGVDWTEIEGVLGLDDPDEGPAPGFLELGEEKGGPAPSFLRD